MSPDARSLREALGEDAAPTSLYGTGVQHGPAYPERFLLRDGLQFLGLAAVDRLQRRAASQHGMETIFRRCDVCGAQERFSDLSPTGMRRLVWEHDGAKHFTAPAPVTAPRRRERTADDDGDDYATSADASLRRMRQAMDARPRQVVRLVGGPEDA